jgi:hypothetical protein
MNRELDTLNDQMINFDLDQPKNNRLLDRFVVSITKSGLPAHLCLAQSRKDLTPIQRQIMLSTYTSGDIVDATKFLHRAIKVLGCTVYEHGPYNRLSDNKEMPGFSYMLIKTSKISKREVTIGESKNRKVIAVPVHTIIKTSSTGIIDFFLGYLADDRAMDFEEPIVVFFTGTQSSGYQVCVVEDESMANTVEDMARDNSNDGEWNR